MRAERTPVLPHDGDTCVAGGTQKTPPTLGGVLVRSTAFPFLRVPTCIVLLLRRVDVH